MPTVGLSKPSASTPIADAVHGTIDLTIFDRELVDHRYFQRLHFVLQNSVNYVAFPSNKNTRFPHSLGVAHLSSQMFSSALSNASTRTLERFLTDAADFIIKLHGTLTKTDKTGLIPNSDNSTWSTEYEIGHQATIKGKSRFLHNPMPENAGLRTISTDDLFGSGEQKIPAGFIIDSIWQAIRLYGLVHDIGHLPMSHAFENAIKNLPDTLRSLGANQDLVSHARDLSIKRRDDFTGLEDGGQSKDYFRNFATLLDVSEEAVQSVSKSKDLHETRGISLYNIFISRYSEPAANFNQAEQQQINKYGLLLHHLSLSIILSSSISPDESERAHGEAKKPLHKHSFLFAVRQLVDGEVDGDRIDYTIRDSLEAGLKTGLFDCEKISKFSLLVSNDDESLFSFGFFHRATDSLEQFFESRYQSYKYQIFNRTSFRSNKCVEELISSLLAFAFIYPETELADAIERYGYIKRDPDGNILDLIPAASGPVEKIDDATLRSLLFELKEYTSKKEAEELLKSREDGSFEASQLIRYLADIVLFRDFSKIVTLFKDNSLKKVVEKSIKTDVDTNRIKKLAVHLLRYSEETVHELRKRVWSKSLNELGHPVVIFWATSGAKVYNAKLKGSNGKYEMNRTFEEETWIVSAEGDNSRVAAVSPALQSMAGRERDDRLSFVFAVGRDMKSQNSKERSIAENEAKDIIRKKYEETTKGK